MLTSTPGCRAEGKQADGSLSMDPKPIHIENQAKKSRAWKYETQEPLIASLISNSKWWALDTPTWQFYWMHFCGRCISVPPTPLLLSPSGKKEIYGRYAPSVFPVALLLLFPRGVGSGIGERGGREFLAALCPVQIQSLFCVSKVIIAALFCALWGWRQSLALFFPWYVPK